MDANRIDALRSTLRAIRFYVENLKNLGPVLNRSDMISEYDRLYCTAADLVRRADLERYVPGPNGRSDGHEDRGEWGDLQLYLIDSATKLASYLQAELDTSTRE